MGVSHAPPAPAGDPVPIYPEGSSDAPLASGGVDEEDVLPANLMPELDYTLIKHSPS